MSAQAWLCPRPLQKVVCEVSHQSFLSWSELLLSVVGMSHFALLLGVALFESTLAKHVGQQRIVVDANGADADTGSSLLRREAELMRLDEGADQRQAVRADCTGLLMAFSCDEHKTAAVCESHKVNSGSDAFRCSWKPSVPAGDNPAVPANCFVDLAAGSCGITNSTGCCQAAPLDFAVSLEEFGQLLQGLGSAEALRQARDSPTAAIHRLDSTASGFVRRGEFTDALQALPCAFSAEERHQVASLFAPPGDLQWVCYPLFLQFLADSDEAACIGYRLPLKCSELHLLVGSRQAIQRGTSKSHREPHRVTKSLRVQVEQSME
ncbi:unnamed protein product [Symbiodinium necroappetens]|uniref:EF-hand domain-containing protein n=1 Tax=Symbiodinium necroappetens TaxID=1628268 RepID=A0A812ITD7_9DINO|nr:unnamed protein product [Symbiodinium necroappetens]